MREATAGKQVPWESSSLEGDFYFRLCPGHNRQCRRAPSHLNRVLRRNGPLRAEPTEEPASRGEKAPMTLKTWKEPVTGLVFVWVPGGCYLMGSPKVRKSVQKMKGRCMRFA